LALELFDRVWTQIEYQNKHYNVDQKDEGTLDDRRRDRGTNFILRIKEQETCLTLHEHDGDDEEPSYFSARRLRYLAQFNDAIRTVTFGKGGAGEPEACVPRCQCGHRFTMLSFSVCCEAGGKVCEIAATAGKGRAACYD